MLRIHSQGPVATRFPLAFAERGHGRNEAVPSDSGDDEFVVMSDAYAQLGGLVRESVLSRLLGESHQGDDTFLACLIRAGAVFAFTWRGNVWVAMFQFDPSDLSVRPGMRRVLEEFAGAFDGWALAEWFATSNSWLGYRRPAEVLGEDLPALLNAARADRFIATG